MFLTAEWFESLSAQLKSSIESPKQSASGKDLRRQGRVGVRCVTQIRCITADGRFSVPVQISVRDISAKGVGITFKHKLALNDRFILELPREEGGVLRLLYTVKNCERLDDDLYSIGGQLLGTRQENAGTNQQKDWQQQLLEKQTPAPRPAQTPSNSKLPIEAAPANNPQPAHVQAPAVPPDFPDRGGISDEVVEIRAGEIRKKMFEDLDRNKSVSSEKK